MSESFKSFESPEGIPEPEVQKGKIESAAEIEWQRVQKRIDVYKKPIQNVFDDIFLFMQAKDMEPVTLPEVPTNGKELKVYLETTRARITAIHEAQRVCTEQMYDLPKRIEGIDSTSPDALTYIDSLLSGAASLYANLAQLNSEDEIYAEKYNGLLDVYKEVRMKEEGFKNEEEIEAEYQRLFTEIYTKESRLFGLGRIFNKKEITALEERCGVINELRYSPFSSTFFSQSNPPYEKSYILGKVIKKITEISLERKKEFDTDALESPKDIPEETLVELNTQFINTVVKPGFVRYAGKEICEKHEETIEELCEIIARSFSVDMRSSWYSGDETTKKRDDIREAIRKLDPSSMFVSYVNNWIHSGVADDIWKHLNEVVFRQDAACEWTYQCLDMFKELEGRLPEIAPEVKFNSSTLKEVLPDTGHTTDIDISRWNIFKQCEVFKDMYGSRLARFEDNLKKDLNHRLIMTSHYGPKEKESIARQLLELHTVEATPYLLLHAFRVGRDHGRYPFLPASKGDSSPLYDCISAYTPEDIETLRTMNIPGLMEVVELILNNKDTFAIEQEYVEEKGVLVTNPVNKEIYEHLKKITSYLLIHDKKSVSYVLSILSAEGGDRELGVEQMGALGQLLETVRETSGYYGIEEKIEEAVFMRFNQYNLDMEALGFMLEHDLLSKEKKEQIFNHVICKWKNFIDTEKGLSEVHMATLKTKMTPLVKAYLETVSSEKDVAVKKVGGFLAARNMGLEFTPTAQEITSLFETKETVGYQVYDKSGWEHLISLSKDITFSKDQSSRIFSILGNILIDKGDSARHEFSKELIQFMEGLMVMGEVATREKAFLRFFIHVKGMDRELEAIQGTCSEANWPFFFAQYVKTEQGVGMYDEETSQKLIALFSTQHPENRDLCLRELKQDWQTYLATGGEKLPWGSMFVCETIRRSGGAGDLKYVEGLAEIINALKKVKIEGRSKNSRKEIFDGLLVQEERFAKEGWSEDDKTSFYNVSKKIIDTSPSLYTDFMNVFSSLSAKELKDFVREFYPLYQANLIVLEDAGGKISGRKLLPLRKRLEIFSQPTERNYEKEKEFLVKNLQENVQERFGLISVPEVMTDEHIRSMKNCIRFIANINEPDATKELIISFYLGLSLHDSWDKFRAGTVTLSDYFKPEKAKLLEPLITERKTVFAALETSVGIQADQSEAFFSALQEETFTTVIGNVQTIDIKLGNVKRGLDDLVDLDLYPSEREKKSIILAMKKGKAVGATLSKKYQQAQGKKITFSPEELKINNQLNEIYNQETWGPEEIKKAQGDFQLLSLVSGIIRKMNDESIGDAITKLQSLLNPSEEIIAIFNSFGEEFKPTSGALALSQDLSYLENIIVKNSDKVGEKEQEVLKAYLDAIRAQMVVLESEYVVVKEYFEKIKKSSHGSTNELFKNRIREIEKVVYQSDEKVPITTTCTSNLNKIIENMRQCLGCMRKEINNDTNLAFGDPNKFFMVSAYGDKKGSSADQIVFFAPLSFDETEEASFVVDQLYGIKSSDVLTAHVETILKKYKKLAKQFKGAHMSVFVTHEALSSAGMRSEGLIRNLTNEDNVWEITPIESASVTILKSAFGDNYVEFGNGKGVTTRSVGERNVSGVRIALKAA